MRRVLVGAGAVCLMLGAVGCQEMSSGPSDAGGGSDSGGYSEEKVDGNYEISVVKVPVKDGRTVTCVRYNGAKEGSLSCDWVGYHGPAY